MAKMKKQQSVVVHSLTAEYSRARGQLILWSGILFAWEFIGIDLTESGIGAFAKSLKNPQAVPWILLILVVYFFIGSL